MVETLHNIAFLLGRGVGAIGNAPANAKTFSVNFQGLFLVADLRREFAQIEIRLPQSQLCLLVGLLFQQNFQLVIKLRGAF